MFGKGLLVFDGYLQGPESRRFDTVFEMSILLQLPKKGSRIGKCPTSKVHVNYATDVRRRFSICTCFARNAVSASARRVTMSEFWENPCRIMVRLATFYHKLT